MQPLLAEEAVDLERLRRERGTRLATAMTESGVDALVTIGLPNVHYTTGLESRGCDSARAHYERPVAVTLSGDPHPHIFAPSPEAVPEDLPEDHLHPSLCVETGHGVRALAGFLAAKLGHGGGRVAVDEYTAAMFEQLSPALPNCEIADGSRLMAGIRLRKTRDELLCIRRAQHINEQAMHRVLPLLRSGVHQNELSGAFVSEIHALGASSNEIDPIWQVIAPSLSDNPFSLNGDVPFPRTSSGHRLERGDVVWVDTGITVHGYASDFGRTWIVGPDPSPTLRQRSQFERWKDVIARVSEEIRPGASGLDLVRAAERGEPTRPWMDHFYLAHGVGLNSAEMPLVGTDMGEAFDASIELREGMVLVLEPAIWEDGYAGYRSEEIAVVWEDGCRFLSDFPYTPFEETPA
ncbi:Xaa-Pro peptidase family protein [Myxococcota bacterium]|nr:Xaa-Pro peptidase family protein [Myxococcota bacterium]